MITIEIRILAGVLVLLFIGACGVVLGIGPDFGGPRIPFFYSVLYGGLRWTIAVTMLFAVPVVTASVLIRYIVHLIGSSGRPFLPPLSWHWKILAGFTIGFVLLAWLLVCAVLLTLDFGN